MGKKFWADMRKRRDDLGLLTDAHKTENVYVSLKDLLDAFHKQKSGVLTYMLEAFGLHFRLQPVGLSSSYCFLGYIFVHIYFFCQLSCWCGHVVHACNYYLC